MDHKDVLIKIRMLEEGVVPFSGHSFTDVNNALESLPPEERRKCRRKFRKLWRKAARSREIEDECMWISTVSEFDICKSSGRPPSSSQRRARSRNAYRYLRIKIT